MRPLADSLTGVAQVLPSLEIHSPHTRRVTRVTSNLALRRDEAENGHGGGGTRSDDKKARKSFVVKILTSKPLGLKILQTTLAEPAPVKAFRGEGGTPKPKIFAA